MSNQHGINQSRLIVNSCSLCRHWIGAPTSIDARRAPVVRECRRFPPVPVMVITLRSTSAEQSTSVLESCWPRTRDIDHCGEFVRCVDDPPKLELVKEEDDDENN